nr:serine--tRNA ligase, mitochondrial [Leptinotarsa decemlineata]
MKIYLNFKNIGILRRQLSSWQIKSRQLKVDFICNPQNASVIQENINKRKGIGNITLVNDLKQKLNQFDSNSSNYEALQKEFQMELSRIPNETHPDIIDYGDEAKLLKFVNEKKNFKIPPKEFNEIAKRLNLVRTEQLGNLCGSRAYYVLGELAELEQSLLNYFTKKLLQNGFELLSVPDILPREIIESCGMNTRGERNQVYILDPKLHGPDLCLSGTSEMALAGYLSGEIIPVENLPKKLAAVSRCYRAETSSIAEERGIYRVHEFTKVEMFMVTTPESSDAALEEIRNLEEENFKELGLHFQVLDMPPYELGAQAYRKYDMEAWMPGRKMYGEISSCSNCTDYQSRR